MQARRDDEQGQVTIFGIGVVLMVLVVGGLGLDLWRVLVERRIMTDYVDAAAAAGANAIDEQRFRTAGLVTLDPPMARAYAMDNLASQDRPRWLRGLPAVDANPDRVVVMAEARVDFMLLSLLSSDSGVDITVVATAAPRASQR